MVTDTPVKVVGALGRAPRWSLVFLRLYLGAAFVSASTNKIGANWQPWPGWMAGVIQERLPHSVPVYREFLSHVILPHIGFFAPLVACTELTVGCCLLLGLATRAAAAAGALLTINYLMLNGVLTLVPASNANFIFGSNDPVFIIGCLTVSAGAVGRALGMDYFLHRRFPRLPFF